MPQKKNPDAAELLRAKAPRLVADLAAFHGVMHALPLAYNKDMQEDKHYLFDSVDNLQLALAAADGMLSGAEFKRDAMTDAASDSMIAATDLADLLVRRGIPFRESHAAIATLVRQCVTDNRDLSSLTLEELQLHNSAFDEEAIELLSQESWLESKQSAGGTALSRVEEQLVAARGLLT
jgi:argininosuccinate lyase